MVHRMQEAGQIARRLDVSIQEGLHVWWVRQQSATTPKLSATQIEQFLRNLDRPRNVDRYHLEDVQKARHTSTAILRAMQILKEAGYQWKKDYDRRDLDQAVQSIRSQS